MSTLLAIDAGNTNVKYGLFQNEQMVEFFSHELNETADRFPQILRRFDAPIALASVAPSAGETIKLVSAEAGRPVFQVTAASQNLLTGMNETMGADRVADAVAAWTIYGQGKQPVILMGFGTATTLLAISAGGHVVGGWIAPGPSSMLEALHARCQLLPLLTMEGRTTELGLDTESHMRNGVFLGIVGLVKQWLESARLSLKAIDPGLEPVTVATGGSAHVVQDFEPLFDYADRQLTLRGIFEIAQAAGVLAPGSRGKTSV